MTPSAAGMSTRPLHRVQAPTHGLEKRPELEGLRQPDRSLGPWNGGSVRQDRIAADHDHPERILVALEAVGELGPVEAARHEEVGEEEVEMMPMLVPQADG